MFSGSGKSSPKKAAPKPAGKKLGNIFGGAPASPTKPTVTNKAKPLSPGSNYPTTQKFQTVKGKSKYGVPIFLPNGNVNPAYLAAERKEAQAMSKKNQQTSEAKRKALIFKKEFELADYVRKKIGNVGSGKDYYSSGR